MPASSGGKEDAHSDSASMVMGELTAVGGTSTVPPSCWITVVCPGSAVVEVGAGKLLPVHDGSTAEAGLAAPGNPVGAITVNKETTRTRAVEPLIQRVRRVIGK